MNNAIIMYSDKFYPIPLQWVALEILESIDCNRNCETLTNFKGFPPPELNCSAGNKHVLTKMLILIIEPVKHHQACKTLPANLNLHVR